jgi:endoglucanase
MNQEPEATSITAQRLERLSGAIGVFGYSGVNNVHEIVSTEMAPLVDRVERDRMGSVIGVKLGQQSGLIRRKIMLAAHLDEIGAAVTKVDQGFLRFARVGGLDDRVLMGQEVIVHGRHNLAGIIGSIPPHFQTEKVDTVDHQTMVIDVGLSPEELADMVQVGDLISFVRPATKMLNGLISGKAMDNRSSIAAVIACLGELGQIRHDWDVYAVATTDEEKGSYVGATTQAYKIRPDLALVLDVTFGDVEEIDVKLDHGPVIGLGPSNHSVIRNRLVEICRRLELKYQTEMMPSGAGTDAYAIEVSRSGVPTVLISIPSRYMHSPVEMVSLRDVERTGRLLAYFIASLDNGFIDTLVPGVVEP